MCAFIVAMFCKDYNQGQRASLSPELVESCLLHLKDLQNPLLRQWSCLCLSKLWVNYEEAKWVGIRCLAHEKLCELVVDPVAEVRAAMIYALTAFLGIRDITPQIASVEESIASMILVMTNDGNSMVRRELLIFFSTFVSRYKSKFLVAAFELFAEDPADRPRSKLDNKSSDGLYIKTKSSSNFDNNANSCSQNTIYAAIWKEMLVMSVDPHPEIARDAGCVVDDIIMSLLESPLAKFVRPHFDEIIRKNPARRLSRRVAEEKPSQPAPRPATPIKEPSYLNLLGSLRRTGSVAASLKNLWSQHETSTTSPKKDEGPTHDESQSPPTSEVRPGTPDKYRVLEEPKTRQFVPRDLRVKPVLPLTSVFYEWSVEYFREPQMKPTEADEPGSTDYNGRLWRRNRNDKIIADTQPLKELAITAPWQAPRGYFDNLSQPMKMCFHQFEDHLVVTDNRNTVNVFDYSGSTNRINSFSNGNPSESKISEVRFINEDDQALLMTGSSDGVIKIFRNYDTKAKTELVTAFRALTDLVPSNRNAGLVFDWQQGRGLILVAGDVKVIRVWNAGTEICTSVSNKPPSLSVSYLRETRIYLHDRAHASRLSLPIRSKAMFSLLASAMAPCECTISDRSLQQLWSRCGKSTSNGLLTCICNVVVSENWSVAAVAAK